MDGLTPLGFGNSGANGQGVNQRSFLFLQGPISDFFSRLGEALTARGHRVHRINLHFGDQLFWRLPAAHFRGRFADWRTYVARALDEHQVTDLVLHGDRRPYHIIAAEEARARGIAVIATDLGYIRPDWITLEHDGMTTYSRFPRDPEAIRALAAEFPDPDLGPRFHTPFRLIASLDIAYNLGLVFGRVLYPNYRYHSLSHPFTEYAGWLGSRLRLRFGAPATRAAKERLARAPGSYFLVPLQLAADYQIRAHSPFGDIREAVEQIIASYAAGDTTRELAIVVHPLDNGLIDWTGFVARLAQGYGVADRVVTLHGGTPNEVLSNAAGVVTINSTIGVTALHQGVPVKVLGNAVFDIAGLTCQGSLDEFWHLPQPPDPALLTAFLRALAGATQVKGGYYVRAAQDCAIAGFVERLEGRLYPLPAPAEARSPRGADRTVLVTAAASEAGRALARAYAAPGTRLCLVGTASEALNRVAADCRQRGAVVEVLCGQGGGKGSLSAYLAALDRRTPLDVAIINADVWGGHDRRLLKVVDAVVTAMRRRGRGDIVLIDNLAGQPLATNLKLALRHSMTFRARAVSLRRRLDGSGASVTVVTPGAIARRAAGWLRAPQLMAVSADRLAELILRRLARRRRDVAVPAVLSTGWRVLYRLPSRLRETTLDLLPTVGTIRESSDDARVAGKSATGD